MKRGCITSRWNVFAHPASRTPVQVDVTETFLVDEPTTMASTSAPARRLSSVVAVFVGASVLLAAQDSRTSTREIARQEAVSAFVANDLPRAIAMTRTTLDVVRSEFGEKHWRTAAELFRLSYLVGRADDGAAADAYRKSAAEIVASTGGDLTPLIADLYTFYQQVGDPRSRDLIVRAVPPRPEIDPGRADARAAHRVALVVGNNAYVNPAWVLTNAVGDAKAVAAELVSASFEVTLVLDASRDRLDQAVDGFVRQLGPNSLALFYYAGHAIEIENENFLIPTDFSITDEQGDRLAAYSVSSVHQGMVNSGAVAHIVILDACRTYFRSASLERSTRLARMPLARNSLVSFSTEGGSPAIDGIPGENHSLFTKHLLDAMRVPGAEIREVFKQVKQHVQAGSAGKQVPWVEEHLLQDFYFHPPRMKWNARDGLDYVLVPKGAALIGCVPGDVNCAEDERPRHKVDLTNDSWIGRSEVTVGAYKLFVSATRRQMPPPIVSINPNWRENDHPMIKVTWQDAHEFCERAGGRLPTETEWEYAARGGLAASIYAESTESEWRFTRPVTESASNAFGVLGMAENVEEWTADWYAPNAYRNSASSDPTGPPSGKEKVVRGGAWDGKKRLSARLGMSPESATSSRGFRCVLPN